MSTDGLILPAWIDNRTGSLNNIHRFGIHQDSLRFPVLKTFFANCHWIAFQGTRLSVD
jgi:hypothetical protein